MHAPLRNKTNYWAALVAFVFSLIGHDLTAADVSARVSSKETYVGVPITLQIRINDARDYKIGDVPEVDGLTIEAAGRPSIQRRRSSINNGPIQVSSTVIYQFRVTPDRSGKFTIPPFMMMIDGKVTTTDAIEIVSTTSETGDLLLVEVTGVEDSVYVGESLDLQLKIWVRPFKDRDRQVELTEGSMWGRLSNKTNWGIFADRMAELEQNRQRPGGRELLRKDSEGNERSYYLYVIDATVYPDRPGQLNSEDLQIAMMYPTALGEKRDPFDDVFDAMRSRGGIFDDDLFGGPGFGGRDPFEGMRSSRLAITSVRPIVAKPEIKPIEVLPVPTKGRPADYRGAVGTYEIVTEATPVDSKVGDPISLRIGIRGTGPLDLVRAPPLHLQSDLTQNFRVADEELPGFVSNGLKRFATTIRPRKEGITTIPPIRFSYFDPKSEQFVTVSSDPIDIEVAPGDTLSLESIVASPQADSPASFEDTAVSQKAEPSVYAGPDSLRPESPAALVPASFWWGLCVPPIGCLAFCIFIGRDRLQRFAGHFRSAIGQFDTEIEAAESPAELGLALENYLGRKYPVSGESDRRSWVVGQLRADGLNDLAVRVERVFDQCERRGFSENSDSQRMEAIRSSVTELGHQIAAEKRLGTTRSRKQDTSGSLVTSLLFGLILSLPSSVAIAAESKIALTSQQQKELLREANERFSAARTSTDQESTEDALAEAASRYQMLIDSGITNSKLYYNLALTQDLAGQYGLAIANLRRALKIDPTHREFHRALAKTEARLSAKRSEDDKPVNQTGRLQAFQSLWMRLLTPKAVYWISLVAWMGIWLVIAIRFSGVEFAWKGLLGLLIVLFTINSAIYFGAVQRLTRTDTAVLATDQVEIRDGDGGEFPVVGVIDHAEGKIVRALQSRGDWVKIESDQELVGWVAIESVEQI